MKSVLFDIYSQMYSERKIQIVRKIWISSNSEKYTKKATVNICNRSRVHSLARYSVDKWNIYESLAVLVDQDLTTLFLLLLNRKCETSGRL